MLALSLHIGSEHYAVPVTQVAEVLPLTALQKIPLAPKYIAGLLDYRGVSVPVVDLCALLTTQQHHKVLTTRIILINYQHHSDTKKLLGLIAERVTETFPMVDEEARQSGISLKEAPYLGTLTKHHDAIVQLINADALLTDEVHNLLYQERALNVSESV